MNLRAQLSLELLLYLALAGLSLAAAIGAVAKAEAGMGNGIASFELEQFSSMVDAGLLENGSFTANTYIPAGLCDSVVYGNELETAHGTLYFAYQLNVTHSAFCPDGRYAVISASVSSGTAYFSAG
ncbi:MAG: hypothetical protein M1286_04190 [Candidatus Marsarchaeota archaeon]|nr:hypothetical protein [Candidatus Marsarchaeota archaeon]